MFFDVRNEILRDRYEQALKWTQYTDGHIQYVKMRAAD